MKLEIENCKCGGHGCTGKLLRLDGYLMDGIHDAETATTLQSAVNLHDELVLFSQKLCDAVKKLRDIENDYMRQGKEPYLHPDFENAHVGLIICENDLRAVLAKVERKGK